MLAYTFIEVFCLRINKLLMLTHTPIYNVTFYSTPWSSVLITILYTLIPWISNIKVNNIKWRILVRKPAKLHQLIRIQADDIFFPKSPNLTHLIAKLQPHHSLTIALNIQKRITEDMYHHIPDEKYLSNRAREVLCSSVLTADCRGHHRPSRRSTWPTTKDTAVAQFGAGGYGEMYISLCVCEWLRGRGRERDRESPRSKRKRKKERDI